MSLACRHSDINVFTAQGLEWFAPLCGKLTEESDVMLHNLNQSLEILRMTSPVGTTMERAAFEIHKVTPFEDRSMMRHLVRLHCPGESSWIGQAPLCPNSHGVSQMHESTRWTCADT